MFTVNFHLLPGAFYKSKPYLKKEQAADPLLKPYGLYIYIFVKGNFVGCFTSSILQHWNVAQYTEIWTSCHYKQKFIF